MASTDVETQSSAGGLPEPGRAAMTTVLLTGGAGFIGSHCVEHWLKTTDWDIVVLDSLSYAGDPNRLLDVEPAVDWSRVRMLYHDLRAPLHDHPTGDRIGEVDYIVNMAAGSHVDTSITHPASFFTNNVDVAVNMLEYARLSQPDAKFVQVSTDEVYGPAPHGYAHREWDPIRPSNPYAGSKAAQEAAAFSWWRTYGLKLAITNTMNNFGERQHPEKFVPMAIRNISSGRSVIAHARPTKVPDFTRPLDHNGEPHAKPGWQASSRVWLHARNHADALRFLLDDVDFPRYDPKNDTGESRLLRYNVAGEREIAVDEIIRMIGDVLGKKARIEYVDFHSSRPGHDLRYALDGTALNKAGWKPPVPLDESFDRTVQWYVDHPKWLWG